MTFAPEHARPPQQTIGEAQHARLVRCLRPAGPGGAPADAPAPDPPPPPWRPAPPGAAVTVTDPQFAPPQTVSAIAARAIDLVKTCGRGAAAVHALAGDNAVQSPR